MTGGLLAFLLAMAVAIAFAWARGRPGSLKQEIAGRELLDADAQRAQLGAEVALDPQTTRNVLQALGKALALQPEKLRLSDRFADLWDMHAQSGFHQRATFERWVLDRYPRLPVSTEPLTIADLIKALQRMPLK